ncbi:TPA: enoyl-CoA hydratase-related protein [Pseudomonas aeruginosa]
MNEFVVAERQGALLKLCLQRPEKYNALTNAMYEALADALIAAEANEEVQAVLLSGSTTCFTSGNDLRDFLENPPSALDAPAFRFMEAVINLSKPLVAAVCGPAIGIGSTLLPHCDQVFITRQSKLSMPFVALGLCQEFGASLTFTSLLGPVRAARLLFSGELFNGQQALDWGLANAAFDDGESCLSAAHDYANQLLTQPQAALRQCKRLHRTPQREALRSIMREENLAFIDSLRNPQTREAIEAVLARSKSRT